MNILIILNQFLLWKTCVYIVGYLASNYWKLAVGECSQQVKINHHLRMFMFILLTIGCRQSSSVLPMSTYTALGVGLTMYRQKLSSIYSFRGGVTNVGLA